MSIMDIVKLNDVPCSMLYVSINFFKVLSSVKEEMN